MRERARERDRGGQELADEEGDDVGVGEGGERGGVVEVAAQHRS